MSIKSAPRGFNVDAPGYRSTAEEVALKCLGTTAGQGLEGKVAIVTGGGGGIGKEAVRVLVNHGAHVIIAARNALANGEDAVRDIGEQTPEGCKGYAEFWKLDLADLSSVRSFADKFKASGLPLHFLINNAGVMALPKRELTKDGFEMQFGTNHLGHFLLTNLLVPILVKSSPSRIVNVSSAGHRRSGIIFDDINFEKEGSYAPFTAYGQSKTANILFSIELARRLAAKGIISASLHPGGIATNLGRHMTHEQLGALGVFGPDGKRASFMKTIPEGAATTIFAALSPELESHNGAYCEDANISETYTPESRDPEAAKKLWLVSEKFVGETFDYPDSAL